MKYFISIIFIFSIITVSGQDAVDNIAVKTCSCLRQMDTTATLEEIEAKMGICMITEATPYQKELKKKNNIDISTLDATTGEALGKLIGTRMLLKCPDQMLRLGNAATEKKAEATPVVDESLTGTLADVVTNQFVMISIKNSNGPDQKFLWLDYFHGEELLKNTSDLKGKTVEVFYTMNKFYNPAIKDYMNYNVLTGLRLK